MPIPLKTPYSAGVHPTAITQPYNIVRFPNAAPIRLSYSLVSGPEGSLTRHPLVITSEELSSFTQDLLRQSPAIHDKLTLYLSHRFESYQHCVEN